MAAPALKPKEVQEFKFRLATRLRVFPSTSTYDRSHPVKSIASCSKYGLAFACEPNGVQCVQTGKILAIQEGQGKPQTLESYPRRLLGLPVRPSHVDVSSDGESLAVTLVTDCALLQIYCVKSFATDATIRKTGEVRLSSSPGVRVTDLQWNPGMSGVIGAVLSDGSVLVVEFKESGGPTISSAPSSTQASCICWSPKGKQVVTGSWNGSLTQFKPDLKAVKTFPAPVKDGQKGPLKVISVYWLSTYQFIASYVDTGDPSGKAELHIVEVPKTGQKTFVNLDDIFFCSNYARPEFYFSYLTLWNLMILSTGNASEAAVIVQENEKWVQWVQDGSCRAELPLGDNHEDAFTIGMSIDTSSSSVFRIDDVVSISPMPVLLMMSHDGVLCLFHVINSCPGAPTICMQATPLPEQYFTQQVTPGPSGDHALKSPNMVSSLTGGLTLGFSSPQFGTVTPSPATAAAHPFQLPQPSVFQLSDQSSVPIPPLQLPPQPQPTQSIPVEQPLQTPKLPNQATQMFSLPQPDLAKQQHVAPSPVLTLSPPSISLPKPEKPPEPKPPQPKVATPPKAEKKTEPKPLDDTVFWKAITDELKSIHKIIHSSRSKKFEFEINEEDLVKKTVAIDNLESFEKDLRETTSAQMSEVAALRTTLIEMCGWIENAKAKRRQTNSQRYFEVVESQELDPVIKKLMKSINDTSYYLENQISATSAQLDAIWAKQSPGSSSEKFDVPELEKIYETIKLLLKIAEEEKVKVEKLQARMAVVRRRVPPVVTRGSTGQEVLERLADKLLATKISDSTLSETATRYILLANAKRELAPEKLASLQDWHKRRSFVIQTKAVRPVVPQSDLLKSLRMTSPVTPPPEPSQPVESVRSPVTVDTPTAVPAQKSSVVKTLFTSTPLTKASHVTVTPALQKIAETPVVAKPEPQTSPVVVNPVEKAPNVVVSAVTSSMSKPAFSFTTQAPASFSFSDPSPGFSQPTTTAAKTTFQFAASNPTSLASETVTTSVKTTSLFTGPPAFSFAQAKPAQPFSTEPNPTWPLSSTSTEPSIFSGKPIVTTSAFSLPATIAAAATSSVSPPKSQENTPSSTQSFLSPFQSMFTSSASSGLNSVGFGSGSMFGGALSISASKPAETTVSSSFAVPSFSSLSVSSTSAPSINFGSTVSSTTSLSVATTTAAPTLTFGLSSTAFQQVTSSSVTITPLSTASVPTVASLPDMASSSSLAITSNTGPIPATSAVSAPAPASVPAQVSSPNGSANPLTVTTLSSPSATPPSSVNFGSVALPSFSSAPVFGASTATMTTTVAAVTSTATPASTSTSIFGGQSTIFADSTSQTKPASIDTPLFGSVPSVAATAASTPAFGSMPQTAATTPSTSSSSLFGVTSALSNNSFFGKPSSPATTSTSVATPSATSIFGGGSQPSTTSTSSLFGTGSFTSTGTPFFKQPNATTSSSTTVQQSPANAFSGFGSVAQKPASNVFGGAPVFGQTHAFGQPAPVPTAGTFGSSGGSLFGSTSFSQPTSPQTNMFSNSGNVFGGGAFSSGANPPVAQTGFGAFQSTSPSPFGSPAGGTVFGGQPTFGSSPTFASTSPLFGSQDKVFGSSPSASPFGASSAGSPTFDKLATQNMDSFGNLAQQSAQQQQPTFGSTAFGTPQPNKPQQSFSNAPAFGGSSFNTWR